MLSEPEPQLKESRTASPIAHQPLLRQWREISFKWPLGSVCTYPMNPPCWNHLESFSLRTTLRSFDLSSNRLTGPLCAVQTPDPRHLFLPETLCPWESFSPLYKSGDIRLTYRGYLQGSLMSQPDFFLSTHASYL